MTKINPRNFLNEKRIPERPVSLRMSLHLNEDNTHLSVKIGMDDISVRISDLQPKKLEREEIKSNYFTFTIKYLLHEEMGGN